MGDIRELWTFILLIKISTNNLENLIPGFVPPFFLVKIVTKYM